MPLSTRDLAQLLTAERQERSAQEATSVSRGPVSTRLSEKDAPVALAEVSVFRIGMCNGARREVMSRHMCWGIILLTLPSAQGWWAVLSLIIVVYQFEKSLSKVCGVLVASGWLSDGRLEIACTHVCIPLREFSSFSFGGYPLRS